MSYLAWRPTRADLAERLVQARAQRLTYDVVPTTGRLTQRVPLPPEGFEPVARALLEWGVHREAGMLVVATGDAAPGATVLSAAPFGPVSVLAPCRVVAVLDEPDHRGFRYGTLPGHPVIGEEEFAVRRHDDGRVEFTLTSTSRLPGLARLAPPAARLGQHLVNRRYLAAVRVLAAR